MFVSKWPSRSHVLLTMLFEKLFFPNFPETKENKIILFHSLLRKEGVLGLLPTGFGKSLI